MGAFFVKHPDALAPFVAVVALLPLLIALLSRRLGKSRRRRIARERNASGHDWLILRGTEVLPAPSLQEVVEWAAAGRVLGSDDLYNPATGRWSSAVSFPAVREAIDEGVNQLSRRKHADAGEIGSSFAMVGMAVIVIIVFTMLQDQKQRAGRRNPDAPAAELQLESAVRKYLPIASEIRVVREGWANSVSIYVRKSDFEEIAFPDRPGALQAVASGWCKDVGSTFITSVSVRDIRNGGELANTRCE